MKPLLIEWIPFYGMFKYIKRYFSADNRGSREALVAEWFKFYHTVSTFLIVIFILYIIKWLIMLA